MLITSLHLGLKKEHKDVRRWSVSNFQVRQGGVDCSLVFKSGCAAVGSHMVANLVGQFT